MEFNETQLAISLEKLLEALNNPAIYCLIILNWLSVYILYYGKKNNFEIISKIRLSSIISIDVHWMEFVEFVMLWTPIATM